MPARSSALEALERKIVACTRCPELRAYCRAIGVAGKREFAGESYWARPVPGIGSATARLLIVGLAPAAHGANRTGRMFTGDASGAWLSRAMHRAGFATVGHSVRRGDGFRPIDAYIGAALRCAPPGNKPTAEQIERCAPYLRAEIAALRRLRVVLGLGKIGFDNALRALVESGYRIASRRPSFAHGASYVLEPPRGRPDLILLGSYHPSRQNTNTGVLTEPMLDRVFSDVRAIVDAEPAALSDDASRRAR